MGDLRAAVGYDAALIDASMPAPVTPTAAELAANDAHCHAHELAKSPARKAATSTGPAGPAANGSSVSEAVLPFRNTSVAGLYKSLLRRHQAQTHAANGAAANRTGLSAQQSTVESTDVELGTPLANLHELYILGGASTTMPEKQHGITAPATAANASKPSPAMQTHMAGHATDGPAEPRLDVLPGDMDAKMHALDAWQPQAAVLEPAYGLTRDGPAAKARAEGHRGRMQRLWRSTNLYCTVCVACMDWRCVSSACSRGCMPYVLESTAMS